MLQNGDWIVFESGETVRLSLHRPSIKAVFKHWIDDRGHSVICSGSNCGYCYHGVTKRARYTASVLIDGEGLLWEFGDDVFLQLPEASDDHGWINLKVTRTGKARRTKYHVREYNPDLPPDAPINLYRCHSCEGYIFPPRYYTDKLPQCHCRTLITGRSVE